MPIETVTFQTISAHPGQLTDMAGDPAFESLPFRPYVEGENETGLIVSVSDFLTYSENALDGELPDFDVENTSAFHARIYPDCTPETKSWWQSEHDFMLLTFAMRGDKDPACMVLVRPQMASKFEAVVKAAEEPADYKMPCPPPMDFLFDDGHKPLPGTVTKNGRAFTQKLNDVSNLVNEEGVIVWRPDRSLAAIPCDMALRLRTALFNGNADVIEDLPGKEFSIRPQHYAERALQDRKFLRIGHPQNYRRKIKENLYTIVPWYAAEALDIEHDGTVEGVRSVNRITKEYNINAFVRTDFTTLHLTLVPQFERERGRKPKLVLPSDQQQMVSLALDFEEGKEISIQGRTFKAVASAGDGSSDTLAQARYPTVFDSHAEFRSVLDPRGYAQDTSIVLGHAQHLAAVASKSVQTVVIRAAGQNFHFAAA